MDQIEQLKQRVQDFVASGVMTKKELATRAGTRDTTLIPVMSEDWNPTSATLSALIRAIEKFETDRDKKKAREARMASAA